MDKIIGEFDFSGVNSEYVSEIKNMCLTFQHIDVDFRKNNHDVCVRINGKMFNNVNFDYIVCNVKDGINVQAMKHGTEYFKFGVIIFVDSERGLSIWPYMNEQSECPSK